MGKLPVGTLATTGDLEKIGIQEIPDEFSDLPRHHLGSMQAGPMPNPDYGVFWSMEIKLDRYEPTILKRHGYECHERLPRA